MNQHVERATTLILEVQYVELCSDGDHWLAPVDDVFGGK